MLSMREGEDKGCSYCVIWINTKSNYLNNVKVSLLRPNLARTDGIAQRKRDLVLTTSNSQFACFICVIVVSAYAICNRLKSIESYSDKVAQSGLAVIARSDVDAIEVVVVSVAKWIIKDMKANRFLPALGMMKKIIPNLPTEEVL